MNELTVIDYKGQYVIDSREVAVMVDKPHDQLMRSIRTYVEYLESAKMQSQDFFIPSNYLNSQKKEQPCYLITKKGCDMVANKMTGEKGIIFTALYVTKFEEMEKAISLQSRDSYMIEDPIERAKAWIREQERKQALVQAIEVQKPLVGFAETCARSEDSLLVRELAKLACKQGINTGEQRLYKKLREWKMIFANSTEPYQEYVDRGYFEVTQSPKETGKGVKVFKTTRVTPKGQIYILDRLKKEA